MLRGEGVLFEVKPEDKLVTLWKDADVGPGVLGSLVGKDPRYRYEIEVVPLTARSSRVVVNVRAEDMPDEDLAKYNATTRLNLFAKIDAAGREVPAVGRHAQGRRRQLRAAAQRGFEGTGEAGDRQRGQLAANRAGQRPQITDRWRQSAEYLGQEFIVERVAKRIRRGQLNAGDGRNYENQTAVKKIDARPGAPGRASK